MTGDEADEVLGIVKRIGPVVLRRAVGMLVADRNMTDLQAFCFAFNVCVDLARHCSATLVTMDRVRKQALAEVPVGLPAVETVLAIVRLTLATEARIIAYMTFRSREEVDQIAAAMYVAFSQTSEIAADDLDAGEYMAIIRLHGDVVKHLVERGRQLPRVITYNYQQVMPSLRMAQRAYADPLRHVELINENHVVHPAFMPRDGKMLAV
jgi:prophage DNA circulation protein